MKKITKTDSFLPLITLSTLALLFGCVPQKTSTVHMSERKKEDTEVLARIDKLQEMATKSFKKDLLITPDKKSAYYFYQQILLLDPDNEPAKIGLDQIVERYLAWAVDAAYKKQPAKARSYIARSNLVDKTHPSIEPTLRQVKIINDSDYKKFVFDQAPVLQDQKNLASLGSFIKDEPTNQRCRYLISAAKDGLVRQIYNMVQQAHAANSGDVRRVRARNQISTPNRLERWCHPSF